MNEEQNNAPEPVNVAEELQKIRDEYEAKIAQMQNDLAKEQAAHVRDVREILLHGKEPEPEQAKSYNEPAPAQEPDEDTKAAQEIAEKMKRIYLR